MTMLYEITYRRLKIGGTKAKQDINIIPDFVNKLYLSF